MNSSAFTQVGAEAVGVPGGVTGPLSGISSSQAADWRSG